MDPIKLDRAVESLLQEQVPDVIQTPEAGAAPAPIAPESPTPGPVGEFDVDDELGGTVEEPIEKLDYAKIEMMVNQLRGLHGNFQEIRDIFPSGDQRREQASELGSILHGVVRDLEDLAASQ